MCNYYIVNIYLYSQKNVPAANFASHSAYCEKNIKICKLCKEPISIVGEKEHKEEYHVAVPCRLCGIPVEKWRQNKHEVYLYFYNIIS